MEQGCGDARGGTAASTGGEWHTPRNPVNNSHAFAESAMAESPYSCAMTDASARSLVRAQVALESFSLAHYGVTPGANNLDGMERHGAQKSW